MGFRNALLCGIAIGGLAWLTAGCESSGGKYAFKDVSPEDMYALLLPASVRIEPFTRPRSFDDDDIPDGIEVMVRPLDQFGDPVKAIGTYQVELYKFQPASGQNKGPRLQFWEVQVATAQQVRQFWDRTSQMFQFKLGVDRLDSFAPNQKYVLTVRYNSPQGEHLEHEYPFEFRPQRPQLAGKGS